MITTEYCFEWVQDPSRIRAHNKKFLPSLWSAAQAEIELLRLLDALNRYVREDAPVDSDQLVERFYILWSRIPLLLTGSESVHVRAAEAPCGSFKN